MPLPRFSRFSHVLMSGSLAVYLDDPANGARRDRCVGYLDNVTGAFTGPKGA